MQTRTMAQALIEDLHQKQGKTVSFLINAREGQGLPENLLNSVTRIDLIGGRPTNAMGDALGFSADLCFGGPPQRCTFKWLDVVGFRLDPGERYEALVVHIPMIKMEGGTFQISDPSLPSLMVPEETPPEEELKAEPKRPGLRVVK